MNKRFPVISNAESFYFKGGKTGILISHGFMGTPQSVRYLAGKLAEFGYSVLAPRLEGHGTHHADLDRCSYEDWFASLEKGYLRLKQDCTEVFVIGQSMGGTLALWLARKYPDLAGVTLINPALTIPSFEPLRGKTEPRFLDEGEPDIKARNVHEITYSKVPIKSIHQLQQLMDRTPAILPEIHCPVLGFKSIDDHLVPPENTDYIMKNIGSQMKNTITLIDSYHVASMDNEKDLIIKHCHEFISGTWGQEPRPSHRVKSWDVGTGTLSQPLGLVGIYNG